MSARYFLISFLAIAFVPGFAFDESKVSPMYDVGEKFAVAGMEVTWFNSHTHPHTITSGTSESGPNGLFNSGLISPDKYYSLQVDLPTGNYTYYCMVHPWETGVLVVEDQVITESPAEEIISQQEKIAELELENQLLRKQLQEAQERFEWLLGILLKTMKTLELYSELTP